MFWFAKTIAQYLVSKILKNNYFLTMKMWDWTIFVPIVPFLSLCLYLKSLILNNYVVVVVFNFLHFQLIFVWNENIKSQINTKKKQISYLQEQNKLDFYCSFILTKSYCFKSCWRKNFCQTKTPLKRISSFLQQQLQQTASKDKKSSQKMLKMADKKVSSSTNSLKQSKNAKGTSSSVACSG